MHGSWQISDYLASILLPGDLAICRSWGSLGVSAELHGGRGCALEEILGFQSGWMFMPE